MPLHFFTPGRNSLLLLPGMACLCSCATPEPEADALAAPLPWSGFTRVSEAAGLDPTHPAVRVMITRLDEGDP